MAMDELREISRRERFGDTPNSDKTIDASIDIAGRDVCITALKSNTNDVFIGNTDSVIVLKPGDTIGVNKKESYER